VKAFDFRDRRIVGGVLLSLTAAAIVVILTRPDTTHSILVANGPLSADTPIRDLDLAERRVRNPAGLVAAPDRDHFAEWTLRTALDDGEPLLPSLLLAPERRHRPHALALDLESAHAVQGDLRAGDLVDVYATPATSDGTGSRRIAAAVYIISTTGDDGSFGSGDLVHLLVAVDDDLAATLTTAADLDLVRVSR